MTKSRNLSTWLLASSLALSAAETARGVSYTATLLHPLDYQESQAFGVTATYQVGQGDIYHSLGHIQRALLWNGTSANPADLTPAGYTGSTARSAFANHQVGYALEPKSDSGHAMLWNGDAASAIDLHPLAGFRHSLALGVTTASQVGSGWIEDSGITKHALLWHGSAESVVDLHPADYFATEAVAASGNSQVGFSSTASVFDNHALLWHGTADSVVDLHPAGAKFSMAWGVFGDVQVGLSAAGIDDHHATLWRGTAASAVDLNPLGYTNSLALAISSAGIVGYATNSSGTHATYWKDTPESAIDLHLALNALGRQFSFSRANAISDNGSIVGMASGIGGPFAVLWTPVAIPETTTATLLICGLVLATLQRPHSSVR